MKIEIGGVTRKLKGLQHWVDHLGRHRYRIRRAGKPYIELKVDSDPSSTDFLEAYFGALRSDGMVAAVKQTPSTGSVRDALTRYFTSETFAEYSASTQSLRRPLLNQVAKVVGDLPIVEINNDYIERCLESAGNKGVRRTRLLALRPFFRWAVDEKLIKTDPTQGIKAKAQASEGHHTWTDEQIEQYRTHHALGTMARVAIELMLNVASRRGDTVLLGPQHLKNGVLQWTAEKNQKRKPVVVTVPVLPELTAAIAACSIASTTTFLTTARGRSFSKEAFGPQFAKWVAEAGLPDVCTAHGLRKATLVRTALKGATSNELMAFAGHATLHEADRYTKKADRVRLAAQAVAKLAGGKA